MKHDLNELSFPVTRGNVSDAALYFDKNMVQMFQELVSTKEQNNHVLPHARRLVC